MKILKLGQPPELKPYQATCRKCSTEIEFTSADGTITYDQRNGDFITVRYPVCNSNIYKSIFRA